MPLNGTAIASSGLASPKSVFSQNKQTNNIYFFLGIVFMFLPPILSLTDHHLLCTSPFLFICGVLRLSCSDWLEKMRYNWYIIKPQLII